MGTFTDKNVSKHKIELNPILNEPNFNECSKMVDFDKTYKANENSIQTSLQTQQKGLVFWKKELDETIERVGEEKIKIQNCLSFINHNLNHINCVLESVKKCKDFRLFGNIKRAGNPSDDTDKALSNEYQLLVSSNQTLVQLGKEIQEMNQALNSVEFDLINELERKVSSLATTLQCQSISASSTEKSTVKNLPVIANAVRDDNFEFYSKSQNNPIDIRNERSGGPWYEEISRCLQRASDVISASSKFRNKVKDICENNTSKISFAWKEANEKIQLDNRASQTEREKAVIFLSHVSNDLSTTRKRISNLRGEIEKHSRHLELALKRVGKFHLKPASEIIDDQPLNEMTIQRQSSAKILLSLEASLEECKEQENKLLSAERELRKSLERNSRIIHTHLDQVQGVRRKTPTYSDPIGK